jgi:hypothetical protein
MDEQDRKDRTKLLAEKWVPCYYSGLDEHSIFTKNPSVLVLVRGSFEPTLKAKRGPIRRAAWQPRGNPGNRKVREEAPARFFERVQKLVRHTAWQGSLPFRRFGVVNASLH